MFARRPFVIHTDVPLISFTFDDFPRSALHRGGSILGAHGLRATYYVSLGLMGREEPSGTMFSGEDLRVLLEQGHELGCHTFEHCHAGDTPSRLFEESILRNRYELSRLCPDASFKTMSYPISLPRVRTKQRAAGHFACCRGGDQDLNEGVADLSCLSACFLEKSRNEPGTIKQLIDRNCRAKGWLILATHDIGTNPTPFGCSPGFFAEIVQYAVDSGSRILPVVEALEVLRGNLSPIEVNRRNYSPATEVTK